LIENNEEKIIKREGIVMKKESARTFCRKGVVLIAVVFIACVCMMFAKAESIYAKTTNPKPFKLLKIGSKNLTKAANNSCMLYTGRFDGGSEIYLYDYKGKMKKGSRFKIKLKKGYKAKIHYVRNDKWKKIKNNFKLPRSGKDWYIDLQVKKGKATAYFWLFPMSGD